MTFKANVGAERPLPTPRAGSLVAGAEPGVPGGGVRSDQPAQHSPEAEGLLQRYLSEIHSYRQLGNAALRELESRLEALSDDRPPSETFAGARAPASALMRPSVAKTLPPVDKSPALHDRLRELSSYLHADLTKAQPAPRAVFVPESQFAPRTAVAAPQPESPAPRPAAHKSTPTAPVLDRIWFEDSFAQMRSSIDQLAEKIPTARLDALEAQFHALMEKLGTRESERSMAPVEAGLKKLAAYLEDNRQWTTAHDARVRGVEDRLDQLSGLVAQSHAAISATALGLEIVARGTGPELARKTAELVTDKLEARLDGLNPNGPIAELARDVATLSTQSTVLARNTDERLRQLQICLDESMDRLNEEVRDAAQTKPKSGFDAETYEDDEDYDSDLITAAQRAARLTEGPPRNMPQQGEPVRYQIPYGEFLPDEERGNSRTGLVVAAVILLLASAAMLYLNLRDRRVPEPRPKPAVSNVAPQGVLDAPATTASIPAVKIAERILPSQQAGMTLSNEIWVTSVTAGEITASGQAAAALTGDSESLRKAAVLGDANAQFSVGQDYLEGKDVERQLPVNERLSKAARWFRRAAENGHAASQYRLATLYELGQGAPKDLAESMVWYERAAEKGHVKAMHNLAVLSITGKSVNYLSAAKWFGKAAEYGLRDSQYNLGILYERGLGVEKDRAKAYQWLASAAQRGDVHAAQRRDLLARSLTDAERKAADAAIAGWVMSPVDEAVNRAAPEPPVEEARQVEAVIQPKDPSAQLMKTAWSTQIARRPQDDLVIEAQRLLANLGYKLGPADGIVGPKTIAAIRDFEKRNGLRGTGQINEALIAKMAFAQI